MDNVLIEVDVVESKSAGGVYVSYAEPVVKNSGVVVAVGDSEVIKVKPGDHVLFERGMGRRFVIPGKANVGGTIFTRDRNYILIAYYDIVALFEED
jgi:co-chaperonin GroES (HSP10)